MESWEYLTEVVRGNDVYDLRETLDKLGRDNWELISVEFYNGELRDGSYHLSGLNFICILKRPKHVP